MQLSSSNLASLSLFHLLWQKEAGLNDSSYSILLADTVIIHNGKITSWFFTSRDPSNGILMRKESSLNKDSIIASFVRKAASSRCGIVASFIENVTASKASTYPEQREETGSIVVRYLSEEELNEFLSSPTATADRSGILQAFVVPQGEWNSVIQAVWSPQLCVFSRRVSKVNLFDTRYDSYERAATFDGAEMYSRTAPLRGEVVSQTMRAFCKNIVQRVAHVTFQTKIIQRMVVYFKIDAQGRVFFLYCSSLRVAENKGNHKNNDILPLEISSNFQHPQGLRLLQTTNTNCPVKLKNDIICFSCKTHVQARDLTEVSYESFINNFDILPKSDKRRGKMRVNLAQYRQLGDDKGPNVCMQDPKAEIPAVLVELYPKLEAQEYRILKTNQKFLAQKIKACFDCYLRLLEKRVGEGRVYEEDKINATQPEFQHLQDAVAVENNSEITVDYTEKFRKIKAVVYDQEHGNAMQEIVVNDRDYIIQAQHSRVIRNKIRAASANSNLSQNPFFGTRLKSIKRIVSGKQFDIIKNVGTTSTLNEDVVAMKESTRLSSLNHPQIAARCQSSVKTRLNKSDMKFQSVSSAKVKSSSSFFKERKENELEGYDINGLIAVKSSKVQGLNSPNGIALRKILQGQLESKISFMKPAVYKHPSYLNKPSLGGKISVENTPSTSVFGLSMNAFYSSKNLNSSNSHSSTRFYLSKSLIKSNNRSSASSTKCHNQHSEQPEEESHIKQDTSFQSLFSRKFSKNNERFGYLNQSGGQRIPETNEKVAEAQSFLAASVQTYELDYLKELQDD